MCGSSTVVSHGWFTLSFAITDCGAAVRLSPSALIGAAHTSDTAGDEPSLFFQWSHARPSPSTNGCGSIEPPAGTWHCNGPVDVSANGPVGVDEVATLRQYLP